MPFNAIRPHSLPNPQHSEPDHRLHALGSLQKNIIIGFGIFSKVKLSGFITDIVFTICNSRSKRGDIREYRSAPWVFSNKPKAKIWPSNSERFYFDPFCSSRWGQALNRHQVYQWDRLKAQISLKSRFFLYPSCIRLPGIFASVRRVEKFRSL
jgi:hypothetical protein